MHGASCRGSIASEELEVNSSICPLPRSMDPDPQGFTALTKVDFSYNEIKSMAPVSSLAGSASSLKVQTS